MRNLIGISALCFLAACGFDPESSSLRHDGQSVTDDVADQLVGHYAMQIKYSSNQKLPLVGNVKSLDRLYKVAQIERDGKGLKITEKSCRLEFEGGKALGLKFSEESIQTSPLMIGRFSAARDKNGQIHFAREKIYQILGAKLSDPINEPLPESKNDPRVIDVDHDGRPGASAEVRAFVLKGRMAYVKRSINSYEGVMQRDGALQGLIKDKTEGVMVDVSNPLMKLSMGKFEFTADPDASKSTVRLLKIDAANDCSNMAWDSLFSK